MADLICARIAEGLSLRSVCKDDDMPGMATVFRWLREHETFREQYAQATEERSEALVEEMLDIADDATNDWMLTHDKDGNEGYKLNGEHIQRSRLRVDTRKWIAAKMKPKKYGDKVDVNHGVQPEDPLAALLGRVAGSTLKPVANPVDDEE